MSAEDGGGRRTEDGGRKLHSHKGVFHSLISQGSFTSSMRTSGANKISKEALQLQSRLTDKATLDFVKLQILSPLLRDRMLFKQINRLCYSLETR
jgi:hypothetical protein